MCGMLLICVNGDYVMGVIEDLNDKAAEELDKKRQRDTAKNAAKKVANQNKI